jgi:DmsE family decaheme c-type cytochrome
VVTCWTAGCHSDVHGSDANVLYRPSANEQYPGFTEATCNAGYTGSDSCLACHCEMVENWEKSAHSLTDLNDNVPPARQGCEACHGAGSEHFGRLAGIGIFEYAIVEEADAVCLKCHRDETFTTDYEKTMHPLAGVSCVSCHNPHNTTEKHNLKMAPNQLCLDCHETERADFARMSSHPVNLEDPRAGMLCIECHNPHGAEGDFLLNEPVETLCTSCHVDKAGPFVYSHAGYDPAMGEGCMTCHAYHGANSPDLLLMSGRGLCLQCHTEQVNHFGGQNCWTSGCHTEHHGSNENFFFFDR